MVEFFKQTAGESDTWEMESNITFFRKKNGSFCFLFIVDCVGKMSEYQTVCFRFFQEETWPMAFDPPFS